MAEIPFESGRLEAVGLMDGEVVCSDVLETTGPVDRLTCEIIDQADGVVHLEIQAVDAEGRLVTDAELSVTATVDGAGTLLSGEPYETLRQAASSDIPGIRALLQPMEQSGILVPRPREHLTREDPFRLPFGWLHDVGTNDCAARL